ncbi:MAG: hypothetical protein E7629_03675 [Ruminococcaceae bacterium]|nr:hypothetical protein [Oscillospiraceae bacterium]
MKVSGRIVGANIDFKTNKPMLMLEVNERTDFEQIVDDLKDKDKLSIEIKPYRQHRSLNANAYAWTLIGKIADAVRAGKDEIYLKCLKRHGQSELISVLSHVPIGNYVKYYEEAGESKLNGKMFTHYRVYKGSSEFDTREMSIFIDGVVSEAKNLGIQTETPNQIAEMKARWGE